MIHFAILSLILAYFLSEISSESNRKKWFCILSALFLIAISGLRSITLGYDTENYINGFHSSSNTSWGEYFNSFVIRYFTTNYEERDPGILFVEKLIGLFTNNDQLFLTFIAIICIVPISKFIYSRTNSRNGALLAFTYYVYFYYSYIPNSAIRQSVALSVLLLAYYYLEKSKVIPSLIAVVFASFFHKTALFFVLLVFLHRLKLNKVFFKYCFAIFIIFLVFYQQLSPYVTQLFGGVYSEYASSYFFSEHQRSYTFIIFLTLIYVITLVPVFKGYEGGGEKIKLLYLGSGMAFVLTPFMLIEPAVLRITVYFAVCNFVLIPHSIQLYKPQYSKIIYLSIFLLLVFMGVYSWDPYYFFWE